MNILPAVRNAVESSLLALAAAGVCLWFLISAANLEDVPVARVTLLALGLACALMAHLVFIAIAVKRSGRSVFGWMCVIVLLWPLGLVAFLIQLATQDKAAEA